MALYYFNVTVHHPATPDFDVQVKAKDKRDAINKAHEKYQSARGNGPSATRDLSYDVMKLVKSFPVGAPRPTGAVNLARMHALRVSTLDGTLRDSVLLHFSSANAIETALKEGFDNCGQDPNCIWAEPLALLRAARGK